MKKNVFSLISVLLLLWCVGCATSPISNDPVEAPYLGQTTTFEGTASYVDVEYAFAKDKVKQIFLKNGFKLTVEDNREQRLVANLEVKEGYVTTTIYFYTTSAGVNLRVVSQTPRDGTRYYAIHERIMSQMK